jgi:pimeloyl-ACP methyl ester carboxylesterase
VRAHQPTPLPPHAGPIRSVVPYARTSDDIDLYYEVHGRGDGVLLLLAGQSNSHHWLDTTRPDFDASFRTVTLDYRGTGRSDKPDTNSYSTRVDPDRFRRQSISGMTVCEERCGNGCGAPEVYPGV